MFSKELISMIEQFNDLRKAINTQIIEESNGLASLGYQSRFCIFINDSKYTDVTIEDLEALVGPVKHDYSYAGNNCFIYTLGTVPAYTLLDERITRAGGAADDVRVNSQT